MAREIGGMWCRVLLLCSLVLLAACSGGRGRDLRDPGLSKRELRACTGALSDRRASFQLLPDRRFEGACSAVSAVKLLDIGLPVTNLGAVRCPLALAFTDWVQEEVQGAAQDEFDARVTRIESFGSYACRPVNNQRGNKLSMHGWANALDIAAFQLDNGRRITVKAGWNGPDERDRTFLRRLHKAACKRFDVVLGPDANALHRDHFHFDMGSGPYCR